ncbi:TlpA family protein disulfide reductase [Azohydromonas aeria]|uniref:TlpA family protein disulfide reductase n=1 Tax=Azohydromonas aeria TaxID=2590212 RepID=UPI0012FAA2C4|nr:TlpA disulfide reductase family protein [Azohydromonas aeria]
MPKPAARAAHPGDIAAPAQPMRRLTMALLLGAPLVVPAAASPAGFALTDTQGRRHSLAAHAGRWVLVNLWATWCAPCLAEMPELQALSRARGDLVVVGVAVDGLLDEGRMARFAARLGVTYPLVAGDMEMAAAFRARVLPTTLLFDPRGRQVLAREGRIARRDIEAVLR